MDGQEVLIDYDANDDYYSQICHVCLSIDRTLVVLITYRELYHQIVGLYDLEPSSPLYLCWECVALLRKVALFKQKALKSHETLSQRQILLDLPKSLSTLNFSITYNTDSNEEIVDDSSQNDIKDEANYSDPEFDNDPYKDDLTSLVSNKDLVVKERDKKCVKLKKIKVVLKKLDIETLTNEQNVKIEPSENKYKIDSKINKEDGQNELTDTIELIVDTQEDIKSNEIDKNLDKTELCFDNTKQDKQNDTNTTCTNTSNPDENEKNKLTKTQKKRPKVKKKRYYRLTTRYVRDIVKIKRLTESEIDMWREKEKNGDYYKNIKGEKCEICLGEMKPKTSLKRHNKRFHQQTTTGPYKCKYCRASLNCRKHFDMHMLTHNRLRECRLCGYQCYSAMNMKGHVRQHTFNVECKLCGAIFLTISDFFEHFNKYHCKFICDYCGVTVAEKKVLAQHMQRMHMPNKCPHCDQVYPSYAKLKKHINLSHLFDPSEDAYCVTCDQQFSNKTKFKQHILTSLVHRKERGLVNKKERVQCPNCPKSFGDQYALKRHHDFVHLHLRNFTCANCGQQYHSKHALNIHIKGMHLGIKDPKNKICSYCQRGFSTNRTLANHMRLHTGEKPFVCAPCDVSYTQQISLTLHNRKVHGLPK